MSDSTPSHSEIISVAMDRALQEVRVALPARVESYDAATQKCSAQPLVMKRYVDPDGDEQVERTALVTEVPVIFPRSGAWGVTFPVAVGDVVLLVFSSSSLDRFLGVGGEVDPEDTRHHNINDAIAIPGMFSFATGAPTDAPANALVINGADVRLGDSTASDGVVRKSDLQALAAKFSAWTPVAGDGGGALKTLLAGLIGGGWPTASAVTKTK